MLFSAIALCVTFAAALCCAAIIVLIILVSRRIQKRALKDAVCGRPHLCPDGSFLPQLETRAWPLPHTGPDGRKYDGFIEFLGISCSRCGKQLCCSACGSTPDQGTMLNDMQTGRRLLRCCSRPRWAVRDNAIEVDTPSPRSPPDPAPDRSSMN